MNTTGYRHSAYFTAKQHAKVDLSAPSAKPTPRRPFSAERAAIRRKIQQTKIAKAHFEAIRERVADFGKVRLNSVTASIDYFKARDSSYSSLPSNRYERQRETALAAVDPVMLAVGLMHDIGTAIVRDVGTLANAETRAMLKRQYLRQLGIVRRPFYYDRENERRRALAAARRKLHRRRTLNPVPTPDELRRAWSARKESKEAMIRLGGMLQDLECYVDNCLRFDGGKIVGRNGGIKGFLGEKVPELLVHYKTLMRYKAMAIKLRQATGTKDPIPTDRLLKKSKPHPVMADIMACKENSFAVILEVLQLRLAPELAFGSAGG